MTTIIFGLIIFGTAVFLAFLEPIMRRCRQRRQEYLAKKEQINPVGYLDTSKAVESNPLPAIPEDEKAAFYFHKIVKDGGILGLLFVPIMVAFLPMNAKILAEAFEVVLNRAGYIITEIPIFGMALEVTDLLIYGSALGIAQVFLGAELAESWKGRSLMRWLVLLLGIIPLFSFEVIVSAGRGYLLGVDEAGVYRLHPLLLAGLSGLQAHVCAAVELLSGYRGIHLFFIPMIQGLFWAFVAPFRMVKRGVITVQRALEARRQKRRSDPKALGFLVQVGACLDEALFDPLRALDNFLGSLVRGFRPNSEVSHV